MKRSHIRQRVISNSGGFYCWKWIDQRRSTVKSWCLLFCSFAKRSIDHGGWSISYDWWSHARQIEKQLEPPDHRRGLFFVQEYRGRSPLCMGTGNAIPLCGSRAAALPIEMSLRQLVLGITCRKSHAGCSGAVVPFSTSSKKKWRKIVEVNQA